jgi:hypothetical protein
MPQNPIVPRPGGSLSALNVTTKTAVKAAGGTVYRVVVLQTATAGSFAVFDAVTMGAASGSNAIYQVSANWPAAGTVITLEFPCSKGIVVDPGTGGAVSVSYS